MTRITVVIESHTEGVHLGMELAGGRVVAAMGGDHSDCLEALTKAEEDINWMINSGKMLNRWVFRYVDDAIAKARSKP
mgnify:CR=1 FL=1